MYSFLSFNNFGANERYKVQIIPIILGLILYVYHEKKYGLLAKEQIRFFLPEGSMQTLVTVRDKAGKFGRILGKFKIFDSKNDCETTINDWMIQEHHAAPYFGQSKEEIAQIHLDNRSKVKDIRDDYSNG